MRNVSTTQTAPDNTRTWSVRVYRMTEADTMRTGVLLRTLRFTSSLDAVDTASRLMTEYADVIAVVA